MSLYNTADTLSFCAPTRPCSEWSRAISRMISLYQSKIFFNLYHTSHPQCFLLQLTLIIPHTCSPDTLVNSIKANREKDRLQQRGTRGVAKAIRPIRPFSKVIRIQKRSWNILHAAFVLRSCWWAGKVVITMWKWSCPNLKVGHVFAFYYTIKEASYSSFRCKVFNSANLQGVGNLRAGVQGKLPGTAFIS